MIERRGQLKRAIIGGFIGLSLGFCFMLLTNNFRVVDALIGTLWLVPLPIIAIYAFLRKKPDNSDH